MLLKQLILVFVGSLLLHYYAAAQLKRHELLFGNTEYRQTDSGLLIIQYARAGCKNYHMQLSAENETQPAGFRKIVPFTKNDRVKFLTVHGNVSYDFFYRSKNDTSLFKEDFKQHTERVWLNMTVNEKYTFRAGFTARQDNSPFMKDIANLNLNFDKQHFARNVKQQVIKRVSQAKWNDPMLALYDSLLRMKEQELLAKRIKINEPAILQKLIEEKERILLKKKHGLTDSSFNKPSINLDQVLQARKPGFKMTKDLEVEKPPLPSDSSVAKWVEKEKQHISKLEQHVKELTEKKDSLRKQITRDVAVVTQKIYKTDNYGDLKKIEKEAGVTNQKKSGAERFFSNIKQISIGRAMVDYTELTAQNVMLTGVNVEYNPSYYAALAAGKIDYGFHDFFGRGVKQSRQHLLLGRLGWKSARRNSVIFTVFSGKKNNYPGFIAGDSVQRAVNIFGYSIETTWRKDEHTFLSAEVAKSTKNQPPSDSAGKAANHLFRFNDASNMGVNIKGALRLAGSHTRLSGFFRKTGEDFQSFSLFTYNTNQQSWQLRADQELFKKRLTVTGMFRQNDFTNLITQKTFKTSTVFKTLQMNLRIPKWPVINAGYYPGSQFYMVDNNTILENAYYILNGSANYGYKMKGLGMTSSVVYNRYFNQATDSGFVLYKGINYMLMQTIQLGKLQLNGGYSMNKQTDLHYYTLECGADLSIKKILTLGAAIKYNQVKEGEKYYGSSYKMSAALKKWFGVQLSYEKAFLPTISNALYPVEIGRVGIYKNF